MSEKDFIKTKDAFDKEKSEIDKIATGSMARTYKKAIETKAKDYIDAVADAQLTKMFGEKPNPQNTPPAEEQPGEKQLEQEPDDSHVPGPEAAGGPESSSEAEGEAE